MYYLLLTDHTDTLNRIATIKLIRRELNLELGPAKKHFDEWLQFPKQWSIAFQRPT